MPRVVDGQMAAARGMKVAIVASRFNRFIVDHLRRRSGRHAGAPRRRRRGHHGRARAGRVRAAAGGQAARRRRRVRRGGLSRLRHSRRHARTSTTSPATRPTASRKWR